jgi:hypothetical protein
MHILNKQSWRADKREFSNLGVGGMINGGSPTWGLEGVGTSFKGMIYYDTKHHTGLWCLTWNYESKYMSFGNYDWIKISNEAGILFTC